jgi:hypothetical protein
MIYATLITQSACSIQAACDTPRQESLNASSNLHLLGNTDIIWETNPPTSGPHYPVPPKGGNYDYPISNLEQVAFLESGGVIIQYLPSSSNINQQELASLASESVIVSPNETLDSFLVATAWTWKLSCKEYKFTIIEKFISDYQIKGSSSHKS